MKTGNPRDFRAYLKELVPGMILYLVALSVPVALDPEPGTNVSWLWMLPVVPVLLMLWAILRQYERCDEFYRRLHSEAFAFGAIMVGAFFTIYGFGENAGWPDIPLIWVGPALLGSWGASLPFVLRRYR